MKALILAAGYATRLYPLTREYPKPLLLVGEKPIIGYIIDKLESIDQLDEIIIVTNSKFILKFRNWARQLNTHKRISLVNDLTYSHSDRRGAIGDTNFVIDKKHVRDDLLIIGGDNLFDGSLNDFLSFAKIKKTHPVIGIYDINNLSQAVKYGVVKIDNHKKIVDFKEKPKNPKSTLIAMCIYYFPKEKLSFIKEYLSNTGRDEHDATGFYIDWLRKKVPVYGFVFDGRWYDIGDHKFYNEAKRVFI